MRPLPSFFAAVVSLLGDFLPLHEEHKHVVLRRGGYALVAHLSRLVQDQTVRKRTAKCIIPLNVRAQGDETVEQRLRVVQIANSEGRRPSRSLVEIDGVHARLAFLALLGLFFHVEHIRARDTAGITTTSVKRQFIDCSQRITHRIPESRSLPSSRLSMRLIWLEPSG